jgi:TolB-like protein
MGAESAESASTPPGAVFLSYASQDAQAAQRVCAALRLAGVEVWFDQSELRGGDAWDRQIRERIHDCRLFIALISAHTEARDEGYFRHEWKLAVERTHHMSDRKPFLVPVVIDDTRERGASVPEKLHEVQWTRLPGGAAPPAFVERIRRLLSPELSSLSAVSGAGPAIGEPVRASWRSKPAMLVIVTVFAALAYVTVDKFWISKHAVGTQAPVATAFNPPPHSIAVLPFINLSGDPAQEYFSDGLTEELLNSLARVGALQVAARTSAFSFKGADNDIGTIGRKLNVGAVLEGSVRRSANTVRVTTQLINTVTGFHLWSQTYDRDLGDVLKLQSEISNAVAEALKVTLLGDTAAKIEVGGTHNPAAFDAYLRGLRLSRAANDESQGRAALDAYTEAIRLDAGYALAFAARSIGFSGQIKDFVGRVGHDDLATKARADAERAIGLAPDMAEGHVALSNALEWHFLAFAQAVEECKRALMLAPGSALVLRWCSGLAADMGQFDTAIAQARRGIALDPLNPLTHLWLANALQKARRYAESIPVYRDALAPDPPHVAPVYGQLGLSFLLLGNLPMARSTCETTPQDWWNWMCLAVTYEKLGLRREAEAQIPKLIEVPVRHGGSLESFAYQFAQINAQWGNREKALNWLEKALRFTDAGLANLKTDPLLDPLRKEPRFQAIEQELKFPE